MSHSSRNPLDVHSGKTSVDFTVKLDLVVAVEEFPLVGFAADVYVSLRSQTLLIILRP